MKRDLIKEIIEIKNRNNETFYEFNEKIYQIDTLIKSLEISSSEINKINLIKYSIINIVACAEAVFRSLVKDLIDNNPICFENIKNLNQANNIKFDLNIINAFQTKTLSIGELISHILSYNNFEDLNSNINKLRGTDLIKEIIKFERIYIYEESNLIINNFKINYSVIIKSVKKIYKLRHIFCHEYGNSLNLEEETILNDLKNFIIFLKSSFIEINEYLHPNFSETQYEINLEVENEFRLIEKEFNDLLEKFNNNSKNYECLEYLDLKLFNKNIDDWKINSNKFARIISTQFEEGSIYNTIFYSYLIKLYKNKIRELIEIIK